MRSRVHDTAPVPMFAEWIHPHRSVQQVRTAENSAAASAGRCVSVHRPRRDRWSTECLEDASAPTKDVAKVYRIGSPETSGGTAISWAPARGRADAVPLTTEVLALANAARAS